MINKEIIYNADGTILKDFDNRNIPQYSHNSVCIGVLIPTSAFDVGEEQTIELAVKKCPSNSDEEITMFNLFGALSKVVNLQGIMYRKYTATLPYSYTDSIGSLKIAWVLKTIVQSGDTTTTTTVLTSNRCVVNVIKSVNNAQDETLETSVLDELEAQIEAKHVKEITEFNNSNETSLIYGLFSEYNFFGWLLQVKWNNKYVMVSPYQNGTDTELLVFANDGKVYRYTDITEASFTKTPLTLSKNEIGSLYVSKITTIANVQINNGISKEEMKSALDINDIEQDVDDLYHEINNSKIYRSDVELETTDTQIDRDDTNIPLGVKEGWLLDPNGNQFEIMDQAEGIVFIEFYTNIKGPKGDEGAKPTDVTVGLGNPTVDVTGIELDLEVNVEFDGDWEQYDEHTVKVPIAPGDGINMDVDESGTTVIIKQSGNDLIFTLYQVGAGTSGTLEEQHLQYLLAHKGVYIKTSNDNEIYKLQDDKESSGYLVYSHVGQYNTRFYAKCITITLSTGGWVLTTQQIGGGAQEKYLHHFEFAYAGWNIICPILHEKPTWLTKNEFYSCIPAGGTKGLLANGIFEKSSKKGVVTKIVKIAGNSIQVYVSYIDTGSWETISLDSITISEYSIQ